MTKWFGVSCYGPNDTFQDAIRSDYTEPSQPITLFHVEAQGCRLRKPFYELLSELDVYVSHVTGYAYHSHIRLSKMREKGYGKPVGPTRIYKYPLVTSMDIGWWKADDALEGEDWYKTRTNFGRSSSEHTKFFEHALMIDRT